jgi:YVTN family beta-propeller protein
MAAAPRGPAARWPTRPATDTLVGAMRLRFCLLATLLIGLCLAGFGLAGGPRPAVSQPPLAGDFTNFESHPVHPICLSPSGNRLFAVNVPDARLSVFDVVGDGLVLVDEIPVGLEPVSVAALSDDVVWVVNHLSDDVSVVDVAAGNVVRTIRVGDEPTDVVFARTSTAPGATTVAFVCVSQEDLVKAYDPVTHLQLGAPIPVFGKDPRALALSADRTQVYVAAFESGNRTTVVPFDQVPVSGGGLGAPPPSPAMRADLPAAPDVALIVQHDGAKWADELGRNWNANAPYTVADRDLFVIDAATRLVSGEVAGVGTLLFNLAAHPVTGDVWVSNTEALNLVRFEPNLRGRFVRNRVSIVDPSAGTVNAVHLNPHINYTVTPGPAGEIAQSLAQPSDLRFLPDGTKAYVAALGSNKLGVLNGATAQVTARIPVGEGPIGLALAADGQRLYAYNRFDGTISIVRTATDVVVGTVSLGFDPTPAAITAGRPFLYDATIGSGHGDASCASCHPFANNDAIAWDLGDPQGNYQNPPPGQIDPLLEGFHPMKGPMATQTLRGLEGLAPLHWRADRTTFHSFNGAFVSLNGRADSLSVADMQAYTDFILTVRFPPNPNRLLTNGLPNPALGPSPARGFNEYRNVTHDGPFTCNTCHLLPTGTNRQVINDAALLEDQDFKIPQLRNMYEKNDFSRAPGAVNKSGIGFLHDGSTDNLVNFLRLPVFQFTGDAQRRDVEAFLFAFDTGTRPSVGRRLTLHAGNRDLAATTSVLDSLYAAADSGQCDLVVLGKSGGLRRGWLYDGFAKNFRSDRAAEPVLSKAALRALAGTGSELTWFGVPPASGQRMALDRDRDTYRDRDELDAGSNPGNPLSTPATVAVGGPPPGAVGRIALAGAAPNPFGGEAGSATTTLRYSLPAAADVRLEVYDAMGRRVATLLDGARQPAGDGSIVWDGRDDAGRSVGAGLYFYRLSALGQRVTAKGLGL